MQEAGRLYRAGRLAEAAEFCRAALAQDATAVEVWHLLGVTSLGREDPEAALAPLERAVALAPGLARAQYHLGNALLALDRRAEAAERFRAALAEAPDLIEAENNLGNALRGMGCDAEAVGCYRRVLARQPGYRPALYNLGQSLTRLEELEDAEAALRAALEGAAEHEDPAKLADMHAALATVLIEQARDEEALAALETEARLRPAGAAQPAANMGLVLLRMGRFRKAWPLYERRWETPGFREGLEVLRPIPLVPNIGALAGKRVLVRGEQGRGDVIQFARYATLLAERGARVILSVVPDLVALLGRVPGVGQVVDAEAPDPPHDVLTSLLSLPMAFGTDLGSIPAAVPYLVANPKLRTAWAERLGPARGLRVGLCWCGSEHSRRRAAMPLAALAPVLAVPGVEFHAMTKEMPTEDRELLAQHPPVLDHGGALVDYAETAALLSHMDLVLSVDTSVAHLAGALGRPVWIMLRHSPDWRWLHGRADSPWYPTARLIRAADRDWTHVIAEVAAALRATVST